MCFGASINLPGPVGLCHALPVQPGFSPGQSLAVWPSHNALGPQLRATVRLPRKHMALQGPSLLASGDEILSSRVLRASRSFGSRPALGRSPRHFLPAQHIQRDAYSFSVGELCSFGAIGSPQNKPALRPSVALRSLAAQLRTGIERKPVQNLASQSSAPSAAIFYATLSAQETIFHPAACL